MRLYTVYDRALEEAGPVFCQANDALAIRAYRHLLQEQADPIDADDYRLYLVGEYDPKAMTVGSIVPREIVVPDGQLILGLVPQEKKEEVN